MKILCKNTFIHGHTCQMLNEIYNNGEEKFKDYVIMFEADMIHTINEIKSKGYKIIYYDMEHIKYNSIEVDNPEKYAINTYKEIKDDIDEFWTYTLENQKYLLENGFENVKFRPFIYTESLKVPQLYNAINCNYQPPIDVLFYGQLNEYRMNKLVKPIQKAGINFVYSHACMGDRLDFLIANSKIVIDLKSLDNCYNQNVVRLFYPVINNRCVLSQHSNDDNYMGDSIRYFTDENDIVQEIMKLLYNDEWRRVASQSADKFKTLSSSGDKWHTSDIII